MKELKTSYLARLAEASNPSTIWTFALEHSTFVKPIFSNSLTALAATFAESLCKPWSTTTGITVFSLLSRNKAAANASESVPPEQPKK